MHSKQSKLFLQTICIASIFIFLGRGIQLLFWDAPFRAFFWDENIIRSIIENWFNLSWDNYLTSPVADHNIQLFIKLLGGTLIISSISTIITYHKPNTILRYFIYLGVIIVSSIAFLEFKEKFRQIPQLFENSIQIMTPLLFIYTQKYGQTHFKIITLSIKILITLTFLSHGLYALGVYNTPANFIEMTIGILKIKETNAKHFLTFEGIMDIIGCIYLFFPNKKIILTTLYYLTLWGFITSLARPFYFWGIHYHPIASLQYIHEFLYRLAHGLLPLALIIYYKQNQSFDYKKEKIHK